MKVGFIGAGSIGSAMIKGLLNSGFNKEDILVKGGKSNKTALLQEQLGFELVDKYSELKNTDLIIVAAGALALEEIFNELNKFAKQPIVSVSHGSYIEYMHKFMPNKSVAFAIPNTPVSVGEGITGISYSEEFTIKEKEIVTLVFEKMGKLIEVPETQTEIFGTVAGCSPAFIDMLIEALSDAAVMNGLSRELSYQVIIQMIKGTATLAEKYDGHVAELKDQVTSPGGSTIRGVAALEENGFRNSLIKAINAAQNA